jgi:cytochrome c oxidase subunit II
MQVEISITFMAGEGFFQMKKLLFWAVALSVVFTLAACGQSSDKPASGAAAASNELKIEASNWKFDQVEYRVKAGQPVKMTLVNKAGVHAAAIKEFNVDVQGGKSVTFTPDKPGTYEILCSIPCGGTEQHTGMKAKLIVE